MLNQLTELLKDKNHIKLSLIQKVELLKRALEQVNTMFTNHNIYVQNTLVERISRSRQSEIDISRTIFTDNEFVTLPRDLKILNRVSINDIWASYLYLPQTQQIRVTSVIEGSPVPVKLEYFTRPAVLTASINLVGSDRTQVLTPEDASILVKNRTYNVYKTNNTVEQLTVTEKIGNSVTFSGTGSVEGVIAILPTLNPNFEAGVIYYACYLAEELLDTLLGGVSQFSQGAISITKDNTQVEGFHSKALNSLSRETGYKSDSFQNLTLELI